MRKSSVFALPRLPALGGSLPFGPRPLPGRVRLGGSSSLSPVLEVRRMHPSRGVALLLLAVMATSCAGPAKLARESERALQQGDLQRAYDLARRAVDKDPESGAARSAMTAAATQISDRSKARVLDQARTDTLGAARTALDARDARAELARYRITLPPDSAYFARESAIIEGAAAIEYRQGEQSLAARHPKLAYAHYRAAESYVPSYRDVQEKLRVSKAAAMTRVALLPVEDDVHIPGISRAMTDAIYQSLAPHLKDQGLQFTELVSPDEVYATMTVKEMVDLSPEAKWRIASGVEAARVISGRVHGLRASTNTFSFQYPIYRRITTGVDTSGRPIVRWEEKHFDAVARERHVSVDWDVEVLDTHRRAALAKSTKSFEAIARVAWTDYRADGNCGDYQLIPPDKEGAEEGKRVRERWAECFGTWTLSEMLEQARSDRSRSLYQTRYRDEFRKDSRKHPVLCGELPGENDMTVIALDDAWRSVLSTLETLDAQD